MSEINAAYLDEFPRRSSSSSPPVRSLAGFWLVIFARVFQFRALVNMSITRDDKTKVCGGKGAGADAGRKNGSSSGATRTASG